MVDNSLDLFGAILGGEAKTDMKTGNIMSKMYIIEINFLFIGLVKYQHHSCYTFISTYPH